MTPDSIYILDDLNFEDCLGGQRTYFREVWQRMGLNLETRPEDQILKIRQHYLQVPLQSGWRLNLDQLAKIFGLSKGAFQNRMKKAENRAAGILPKPRGRPLLLNKEQEKLLYDEVERRQASLCPPEPIEVTQWLNTTLKVDCSPGWILNRVNREQEDPKSLFCVKAQPLERPRAEVTAEMLIKWAEEALVPNLAKFHPELFFNFDETSDAPRRDGRIKKVIATTNLETSYVTQREGITIYS